jgi:hypothetical protein
MSFVTENILTCKVEVDMTGGFKQTNVSPVVWRLADVDRRVNAAV